jgi:hypothetical protein
MKGLLLSWKEQQRIKYGNSVCCGTGLAVNIVSEQMWNSTGTDVEQYRNRCGTVQEHVWNSTGIDVEQYRNRFGTVGEN